MGEPQLNLEVLDDGKQSVITEDRLKRFNEIQGVVEDDPDEVKLEEEDYVDELGNPNEGTVNDDTKSVRSKAHSHLSEALIKSRLSQAKKSVT